MLLYLLKLKRKEHMVSSTFLWRDAVADIQANAPFQKLRKSLLLILQLLALLCLVVAVARPYIRTKGSSEHRIVVIFDSSASMQAKDCGQSRFEQAKIRALGVVKDMGPGDTMLVITAGTKTRVEASFTSDKRSLASVISGLRPTDAGCNMRQALVLALSLVAGKSAAPPRIAVFSDGGFGNLTDLAAGNAKIIFTKIGRGCDNIAITGIDSRKTLSNDQQVFIGLKNYSRRQHSFNLEIYLNDQLMDIREETLAPSEAKHEIIKNVSGLSGRITAKLDIKDDLAADNMGSVYLEKPHKIAVLLITRGNLFLQNALNLDPRTQLTRTDSVPANFDKQKYDLVIFDRVTPPHSLPPGGYLLIDTTTAQGPGVRDTEVNRPSIIDSARSNPITAYVDFSGIRIAKAHYLKPKNWAAPIIDGENGALGIAGSSSGCSFVQIGFDLLQSDFPLRVGFPVFIANCLDNLIPSKNLSAGESIRTGQPMYIEVPPSASKIDITCPDGEKQTLKVAQSPAIFDNTEEAGVYKINGNGIKSEFTCNLVSARESDTNPRSTIKIGGKRFAASGKPVQTNREFYGPLILIVLAVLVVEWYAYHRGV